MELEMKPSKASNQVVERIVGLLVLLVAIAAVVGAGYLYLKSRRTQNWPAVEGVITKSGTRSQYGPNDSGAPTTIADVRYQYTVNGMTYRNDTISHAQYGTNKPSHAVKEARKYPAGRKVMVYYNPEDPHDAVLEHKTPWIFISIFAGAGALLIFIAVGMLSGSFGSRPPAESRRHYQRTYTPEAITPAPTGTLLKIAVLLSAALSAALGYYFFFNENTQNRKGFEKAADFQTEGNRPQPLSTYSRVDTAAPCSQGLKAQVAQRQKIRLADGIRSLVVTATLCIDEQEMKAASQTQRTWPAIARQLATYDKSVFDPESTLPGSGGQSQSEDFKLRLSRIEQECLDQLHENSIFFVKAIRFEFLQVFKTD